MAPEETQEILDQMYDLVTEELERVFVLESDDDRPESEPEPEEAHSQMTWRPVAQECVVTVLEPILRAYAHKGRVKITEEMLTGTWRTVTHSRDIGRSIGLEHVVDVELVMAITAKTIADSDIFKTPKKLEIDGKPIVVELVEKHI